VSPNFYLNTWRQKRWRKIASADGYLTLTKKHKELPPPVSLSTILCELKKKKEPKKKR
jgi:hypothetical protein